LAFYQPASPGMLFQHSWSSHLYWALDGCFSFTLCGLYLIAMEYCLLSLVGVFREDHIMLQLDHTLWNEVEGNFTVRQTVVITYSRPGTFLVYCILLLISQVNITLVYKKLEGAKMFSCQENSMFTLKGKESTSFDITMISSLSGKSNRVGFAWCNLIQTRTNTALLPLTEATTQPPLSYECCALYYTNCHSLESACVWNHA
jgi:hypothetical protein